MAAGDGAQLPATVAASRSVEKALEEAAAGGNLRLAGRKLKLFPRSASNHDLADITAADLSRNRLAELPEELCNFISLESLSLYHNGMRSLSPSLSNLQALAYLNLSRNLLSSLPPSVFQLPLLRVLIVSNNKLSSLPASIISLTHLRQLDVSCNELQSLPVEIGDLKSLRDLNLRRNHITTLPEELANLPLVRLDLSCNRLSHLPLCYRHLRHLQSISLDNNPLQMPPAQICSKGKFHIFKFLNIEACKRRNQDLDQHLDQHLEKHLRPTGFNSCLLDQELFAGPFGGLDSGFNSVDSGSKRWSGNESADDFSERSVRLVEVSREPRNLEEEEEEVEEVEEGSPLEDNTANGEAEQVDFIDSSVTEEEVEEEEARAELAPVAVMKMCSTPGGVEEGSDCVVNPQEKKKNSESFQSHNSAPSRASLHLDASPSSSSSSSPLSPSSPSMEERRRPGTLFIWQERERIHQQREKTSLLKSSSRVVGQTSATLQTGSSLCSSSPDSSSTPGGRRSRCPSSESSITETPSGHMTPPRSRTDWSSSLKTSPPPSGHAHKPNSFLFRTSSRGNVKPTVSSSVSTVFGSSCSRPSSREDRQEVTQLRQTLESRLQVSLSEDLCEALSSGTVLCQLVNHIRPRSVSIIHVPSPAVPKLSPAKCRLNVENFLAACRKLGVPEAALCVCSDVLVCQPPAVLRCVTALLSVEDQTSSSSSPSSLLSTDFLLFYCAAMALLYVLYCYLLL